MHRRRVRRAIATCSLAAVALAGPARAGGLVVEGGSPRAIGRAGVGTVGDDGGGALVVNPAAMARRARLRMQLAIGATDEGATYRDGDPAAPVARDQAGSRLLPLAAVEASRGDWIFGAGVMTSSVSAHALRPPDGLPADQLGAAFGYRYAGLDGVLRRDTLTVGAAVRISDNLAVGAAIAGQRVAVRERRRLWAGFGGRDALGDPRHDVEVALDGSGLGPSAVVGALVVPGDERLELGLSASWSGQVAASGTATAAGTAGGPTVTSAVGAPRASIDLAQPLTLRAGARWLDERWAVEVDGDLWLEPASAAAPTWAVAGLEVADPTGAKAAVTVVPSRLSAQRHGALRAAGDVELVAGFLWATVGYAYTAAPTATERLAPSFAALGGHTGALGLEVLAGGATVTLGWARTWAAERTQASSAWRLDNPFAAGDGPLTAATYGGTTDVVGVAIEVELDCPDAP